MLVKQIQNTWTRLCNVICVASDAAVLIGYKFFFAGSFVKAELSLAYKLQFSHFEKKNPLKVTIIAHFLISHIVYRSVMHLIESAPAMLQKPYVRGMS